MSSQSNLSSALGCLAILIIALCVPAWSQTPAFKRYVGSAVCLECHQEEYLNFQAFAKKAHSYESIKKMQKGLTEAEIHRCFECHTTGYKKPGGFTSEDETPHLKDAGCEVCHGPGSLHVETRDPQHIKGKLTPKDCEVCHSAERVRAFNYKPLVYGGAH